MNIKLTKFLLPLAALALFSTACDPFPAKPGGDPAIVRVITYGGALAFNSDSNTVETVTGGNTVSTDFAQPDDQIRIQFNKPMDGSTIQKYGNYDTIPTDPDTIGILTDPGSTVTVPPRPAYTDLGVPFDSCTPATNLVLTGFEDTPGIPLVVDPVTGLKDPATGFEPIKTRTCYDPSSATDGGQLVLTPGAPLKYGTVYTISGTVKDYQGKSLTINVSLTVDKRPLPFGMDGYTTGVDWFDSGATSYEVLRSLTGAAGSYTTLFTVDPAVDCDGVICEVLDTEKVPDTAYWYQVKETTGTTTTRPDAMGPATTLGPLTPTLGVATTTPAPPAKPVILKGIIRVAWGSIKGSDGYNVETSTDGAIWTLYSHHTTLPRTVYVGTPAPGTTVPTADGTLTSGATYYVRVTPTFADLFAAAPGNTASKVAP